MGISWIEMVHISLSFSLSLPLSVQGYQKVCVHLIITTQKLKVMFKVPPTCLQTFIDTQNCSRRLTLTPSVIPNSNYVIMVSDLNCLKFFFFHIFCTVIIRCIEIFDHPVHSIP
jgi:hypothetical protein